MISKFTFNYNQLNDHTVLFVILSFYESKDVKMDHK